VVVEIQKISRFSAPEDIPGYLIRVVSALWRRRLNQELESIDLTEVQFILLMGIGWRTPVAGGTTQAELSAFCRTTTPLTSQVLTSLSRKRLIQFRPKPGDGRARLVSLSPAGEKKLVLAVRILEKADAEIFGKDPAHANRLKADLRAVIGHPAFYDEAQLAAYDTPARPRPSSKRKRSKPTR
jgi:MarR family transcriptional regulator, organic hydroperoxide resistance regulator